MKFTTLASASALVLAGIVAAGSAQARDQIRIVGSSTVFPFSTQVAETFGKSTSFKTPVVESTGSGGGMKLFCVGVGEQTPDITNASRRIKSSEFEKCKANGVTPVEVKIGFDGIVVANAKSAAQLNVTLEHLFLATAKTVPVDGKLVANPYKKWSDIDPSLPNLAIEILGPPKSSGTRDAFEEIAMEGGAKQNAFMKALRKSDKKKWGMIATEIREDGHYIEAGENDNLIVDKLEKAPNRFGIFGFSFLDQNADRIKGAKVGGVEPTFDNIAAGEYPISRSLYFYVKKEHVGVIPGIKEFISEFTSAKAWGNEGYLSERGLIPLPDDARKASGDAANNLVPLSM